MTDNTKEDNEGLMNTIKRILGVCLCSCLLLTGCIQQKTTQDEETPPVSVAMLKGPTGVGALGLMDKNNKKETSQPYTISVVTGPDEAMAGLINGDYQIAALPANVAAALYQKSEGDIRVAAINTLGALYVLERGNFIQTVQDLEGKTIYATGQGATPEYVLKHILDKNGVTNVDIQFMQDHAELAGAIAAGSAEIALLPEPNVTSVLLKSPETRIALDIQEQWEKVEDDAALAMGCIAVSKDFYEQQPEALEIFIKEYRESVVYVENHLQEAAALAEQYEVISNQAAAIQAIPHCSIVFIDGEDMQNKLQGFYEILLQANPKSIGGKLPDETFYIK